jgi:signal transduction histidine kinase/ActR/RegA family two-component response regulator
MPDAPAETHVCPQDASRAALDFVHQLLCWPAGETALDDLLSGLAGAFRAAAAGIAGPPNGNLLVYYPPARNEPAGAQDEAGLPSSASQDLHRPQKGRLQTAFGPAGGGWVLWLEDPGRDPWTPAEAAALELAGQVLGRALEAGDREAPANGAPRWVRQLERATRQQRLQDAARLARQLAHDFGNVLTGIVGFAELALGQQVPVHSALFNYLSEVHRGAEAGAAFTRQLRLIGGRQATVRRPCRLAGVLAEDEVRRSAGVDSGVELQEKVPDDLPPLAVDAEMLKPALAAVLDNARVALCGPEMPPDAPRRITVAARTVTLDPAGCRDLFGDLRPGPHVEIVVADTGPGLSAEARERLFVEPFFSSRSRRRGFGLATTHGILCAYRGGLDVRPGPARGVEVRLVIPVGKQDKETEPSSPCLPVSRTPCPASPGRGEKVLVVDDDAMMRAFVARVLEQAGYRVAAVASAEAALETYAAAADDPFRVVLSDVLMPEVNGVELAHRLLNRHPGVRVLFMSGQGGAEILRQTFQGASFEMLSKPFRTEGLLSAVRVALESKGVR